MIISIPVNYICNLSCKYCYFDKSVNKKINIFILDKIFKSILSGYSINGQSTSFFLDMKEPMLHQEIIILIIEYIERKFEQDYAGITIFTNGTLPIQNTTLTFLLQRKEKISFHISLDGINNFSRGVNKKQFFSIIANIKKIKKYFIYNIWYVLDDYDVNLNQNNLEAIYSFFIKMWFLNIQFYRKRILWVDIWKEKYKIYSKKFIKTLLQLYLITKERKKKGLTYIKYNFKKFFVSWYGCGALKNEISWYDLEWNKHFCSEAIGLYEVSYDITFEKVKKFKAKYCVKCYLQTVCSSPCILEKEYKCIFNKEHYTYINNITL